MSAVLDASALLAYLQGEPGTDAVTEALAQGAFIGRVNLAEVFSKVAERGKDPGELEAELSQRGLLYGVLEVLPFTREDALEAVRLRPLTRPFGLSLTGRACLALAGRLGLPALTTDKSLARLNLGIDVRVIR